MTVLCHALPDKWNNGCVRTKLRRITPYRSRMQQSVEAPTPKALADLVARCDQINRFAMQLTAVEEHRVAALAAGILVMRQVLDLPLIEPEKLPMRQGRIQHWGLTGGTSREPR